MHGDHKHAFISTTATAHIHRFQGDVRSKSATYMGDVRAYNLDFVAAKHDTTESKFGNFPGSKNMDPNATVTCYGCVGVHIFDLGNFPNFDSAASSFAATQSKL